MAIEPIAGLDTPDADEPCERCGGDGDILIGNSIEYGEAVEYTIRCRACRGTGTKGANRDDK